MRHGAHAERILVLFPARSANYPLFRTPPPCPAPWTFWFRLPRCACLPSGACRRRDYAYLLTMPLPGFLAFLTALPWKSALLFARRGGGGGSSSGCGGRCTAAALSLRFPYHLSIASTMARATFILPVSCLAAVAFVCDCTRTYNHTWPAAPLLPFSTTYLRNHITYRHHCGSSPPVTYAFATRRRTALSLPADARPFQRQPLYLTFRCRILPSTTFFLRVPYHAWNSGHLAVLLPLRLHEDSASPVPSLPALTL